MAGTPQPNRSAWTTSEAQAATKARVVRDGAGAAVGVTTDSRGDLEGRLFLALRGERFDGHQFAQGAVERGAAILVVDEAGLSSLALPALPEGVSVLVVADTTRALGDLARCHRERWSGTLVGIAGSAGKTTTRSVVSAVLESLRPGCVLATEANFNNQIGVALTLLRLEPRHELAVLEIGTNRPGEVLELCRLSRPDVGVLTLIDLEHTEGLTDLDGVEQEEGALFQSLAPTAVAIGCCDDPRVARQLSASPARNKWSYGLGSSHRVRLASCQVRGDLATAVELVLPSRELALASPLVGVTGALALAAAACVAEALFPGLISRDGLERALSHAGERGRATLHRLAQGRLLVDDSYNANPASVRQAVHLGGELAKQAGGRLLLVLGEMLELGKLSGEAHEEMGRLAASSGAALLVTVGAEARITYERARTEGMDCLHFSAAEEVGPVLLERYGPGDVVVVKASRGVRAERIVRYLLDSGEGKPPQTGAT